MIGVLPAAEAKERTLKKIAPNATTLATVYPKGAESKCSRFRDPITTGAVSRIGLVRSFVHLAPN